MSTCRRSETPDRIDETARSQSGFEKTPTRGMFATTELEQVLPLQIRSGPWIRRRLAADLRQTNGSYDQSPSLHSCCVAQYQANRIFARM